MSEAAADASGPTGGSPARRRRRSIGGRPWKVSVRFTEQEYARVGARAAAERMTVANYLARLGLAGSPRRVRVQEEAQLVAHQLMMLRAEVRRVGQNVNQVARLLQGTGELARHAEATYRGVARAMAAVEDAAARWRTAAGAEGQRVGEGEPG